MWRHTAAPAVLDVECSGEHHQLLWRNGAIELPDHPDVDAELALVAFGGAEPACINRLKMWENAVADGGFLAEWFDDSALTPSWLSWLSMALERMRTEGFHEVLRGLPPARSLRMGEFIEQFPIEWMDRAAAEISEALVTSSGDARAVVCDDAARHVRNAIGVRLRRAFVRSIGNTYLTIGAAALVPLDIIVAESAAVVAPPTAAGQLSGPGRGVSVVVGPGWLHGVWAAGAATINQRLVLGLTTMSDGSAARATVLHFDHQPGSTAGPLVASVDEVAVLHDGTSWIVE